MIIFFDEYKSYVTIGVKKNIFLMVILLQECIQNNFYWLNLFVSENIWGLLRRLESLAIIVEWIFFFQK
jgi:hypothetical protein